jgi:hypothetical protein
MNISRFETGPPGQGQFLREQAEANAAAHAATVQVMNAATRVMQAEDVQEFAAAIAAMHRALEEQCRIFDVMRRATLAWRRIA